MAGWRGLTSVRPLDLLEVRGLPQQADGLHEHVLDEHVDVAAGEALGARTQLPEVGVCSRGRRQGRGTGMCICVRVCGVGWGAQGGQGCAGGCGGYVLCSFGVFPRGAIRRQRAQTTDEAKRLGSTQRTARPQLLVAQRCQARLHARPRSTARAGKETRTHAPVRLCGVSPRWILNM